MNSDETGEIPVLRLEDMERAALEAPGGKEEGPQEPSTLKIENVYFPLFNRVNRQRRRRTKRCSYRSYLRRSLAAGWIGPFVVATLLTHAANRPCILDALPLIWGG